MKIHALAVVAALTIPGAAHAEDFTIDADWGELKMTGGIGPDGTVGQAGERDATYVATYDDGRSVNGSMHCIGMNQPSGALFPLHMSCDAESQSGQISLALGCIWRGEPGPGAGLSCVGFMTGKGGPMAGRGGMMTMNWTGPNKTHGTGQWWAKTE